MAGEFAHCRFCGGAGCAACPVERRRWEENGGSFPPSKLDRQPLLAPARTRVGDCYRCGAPAYLLCDGIKSGGIVNGRHQAVSTCDRPMCDEHVAHSTRVHAQKAGPRGRGRRCEWNTIDYCADCLARVRAESEARAATVAAAGMVAYRDRELADAIQWSLKGGQALHLHRVIPDPTKAPRVFVEAVARGDWLAHLFDRDADRLVHTARRLGVRVVHIGRQGAPGQHVDLCAGPLDRALAECRPRMACACGWSGPPALMIPTPSGGLACPDCGGTGGITGPA